MLRFIWLCGLLVLPCVGATAATYRFDISGYSLSSSTFSVLGIAPTSSATLEITFDDAPSRAERTIDTSDFFLRDTQYAIQSYRFEIGGLVVSSSGGVANSEVFVRDGIESRNRTTFDFLQVTIREETPLPNGASLSIIQAQFTGNGLNDWTGVDVPSPDVLNATARQSSFLRVADDQNRPSLVFAQSVEVTDVGIAPVPLPASLPLLLAVTGGFLWVGRRRSSGSDTT
ncbi:MAG: hypothetical protein AAGF88_09370 [Pseudomonadota bacterium]